MLDPVNDSACYCGNGLAFGLCCGLYIAGNATAPTAIALMRSRYTAYAVGNADYLAQTWHPSTRPQSVQLENLKWTKLEILSATENEVEFLAHYLHEGRSDQLHERSRFVFELDRWWYVGGSVSTEESDDKIARNALCPCGSGKKYKRCCGVDRT